jgi:hypothetical protein
MFLLKAGEQGAQRNLVIVVHSSGRSQQPRMGEPPLIGREP